MLKLNTFSTTKNKGPLLVAGFENSNLINDNGTNYWIQINRVNYDFINIYLHNEN